MISGVDSTIALNPNAFPEGLNLPENPYLQFYAAPGIYNTELDGLMPGATHFVIYPYFYLNGLILEDHTPYYDHGGYLVDTNQNWDAFSTYSNNNGITWATTFTRPNSIQTMLYAILSTYW